MGSELVGDSSSQEMSKGSSNTTPFIKYSDIFEEYCSFYMSIGMTYDEYWNGDCMLTKYYFRAYKLRVERETKQTNYNLWLQGFYIYEALCDVSPILHAFASKGTKPLKYRERPIPITEDEIKEQEIIDRNNRLIALRDKFMNSVKQEAKNGR